MGGYFWSWRHESQTHRLEVDQPVSAQELARLVAQSQHLPATVLLEVRVNNHLYTALTLVPLNIMVKLWRCSPAKPNLHVPAPEPSSLWAAAAAAAVAPEPATTTAPVHYPIRLQCDICQGPLAYAVATLCCHVSFCQPCLYPHSQCPLCHTEPLRYRSNPNLQEAVERHRLEQ